MQCSWALATHLGTRERRCEQGVNAGVTKNSDFMDHCDTYVDSRRVTGILVGLTIRRGERAAAPSVEAIVCTIWISFVVSDLIVDM